MNTNSESNGKGKIVVLGGTGLIGKKVVEILRGKGHEVVAASPSLGVNALTGEGIEAAFHGARVVVDVTNSPSFEDQAVMDFFRTSTTRVVEAAREAGVGKLVVLSVVGTDRLQEVGYFRAKLVQENLIRESGLQHTIIRATQFFEFIGTIAHAATVNDTVRLSSVLLQPIAAADVASAVADGVLGAPVDGIIDLAGPEALPMTTVVDRFLRATGDPRPVVEDAAAGYFGTPVNEGSLVPDGPATIGTTRLEEWLSRA